MNIKDLKDKSTTTGAMVEFYNENISLIPADAIGKRKEVKKFADRKTAVARCTTLIRELDLIEAYGEVNCPHCGINLDNGVGAHGDEVNGEIQKHETHIHACLGCGEEFGPLIDSKKTPKTSATRSEGIARSWADPKVAAKRSERHGVEVKVKGEDKMYFGSVRKAYLELGLPLSGHIKFRIHLKEKKTLKENGRTWKVVPLKAKKEKK